MITQAQREILLKTFVTELNGRFGGKSLAKIEIRGVDIYLKFTDDSVLSIMQSPSHFPSINGIWLFDFTPDSF